MNALESPLEALALDYLAYGFLTAVNNIWAWLAVITAAVSFWRIRASSSTPERSSRSQDAPSTSSASPEKTAEQLATVLSASTMTSCRMLEREGSTKMKFSLFYTEDDEGDESDEGGDRTAVMSQKMGRWCDDWERMMVMRMGDMGWYKWQDTTVLDGSVVRLWEGSRRREAAALVVDGRVAW